LFGADAEPYRAVGSTIHVLDWSGQVNLGGGVSLTAGLSFDLFSGVLNCYGGGILYRSNCHCWGGSLTARMFRGQSYPDVFLLIDLAYLGSAGVGTAGQF
jgi:hypothetical protein